MAAPLNKIRSTLQSIRAGMNFSRGARILGAHVESPFISEKYCGAQAVTMPADFEFVKDFADVIKIITIAPEVTGLEFISQCRAVGIIPSVGHSGASYELAMAAIGRGANHVTHLFNAQSGLHHRQPGIVGAALDSDVTVEIIADNVHVHPAAQRIVAKVKPRRQITLITDSIRACGLGDGLSELGGQRVYVHGNRATLEDGTLAGSVATMNTVLKNFCANTGLTVTQGVELVTKNPAQDLNVYGETGSLEVGKFADITVLDDDFNVKATFVNGNAN